MITHNLVPNTPEWLAYRATMDNASDAPAMLGCGLKTRTELMHEKHSGLERDVGSYVQEVIFNPGHRFEVLARPLAEEIIGEDLAPVVGSLEGTKISASFDGLTMMCDVNFEHKRLNAALRAIQHFIGQELPLMYRVQMEQQMLVSGAEKTLFMASEWDADDKLIEERHCWYMPDLELRQQIIDGWAQFEIDLAAYVPVEVLDKPIIVTRRPDQLPALQSSVKGELVLESNIKEWEAAALSYIKGVSEHELKTDEDFENADEATKWCVSSKTALQGVRANLMGATGDVNVAVGTVDRIMAELDKTRLAFTKQIDARKAARKVELLSEHKTLLADHIRNLNTRLGRDYMPEVPADFAGAIHGKRNFASMSAALNATLANSKIAANSIADKIDANLKVLRAHEADYKFLFNDVTQLVIMNNDHLVMLVDKRIADHKAAEAAREEATRERIRAEEVARLAREQAERERNEANARAEANAEAERNAREAERLATQASADAIAKAQVPVTVITAVPEANVQIVTAAQGGQDEFDRWRQGSTPAAVAARIATPPSMSLGEISTKLGFNVTSAFLATLGFEATTVKAAKMFHSEDFPAICRALIEHIESVCEMQAA